MNGFGPCGPGCQLGAGVGVGRGGFSSVPTELV